MFENNKKLVRREDLFELLKERDQVIKNMINYQFIKLEEIKSKTTKEILSLRDAIRSLKEKIRKLKEEEKTRYYQDEIQEKYCYKVQHDDKTSLWENEKLFKEWFKNEIFKKKEFKANEKAWAIITEILKEDTDEEMD